MFDLLGKYLSENIIKNLCKRKVVCWNNGKQEYLRIKKDEYTSFQVAKFMTKIHYPPNVKRDYSITVYIHYIEYRIKEIVKKENIKVDTFEEYKMLYYRVLEESQLEVEPRRFYKNFLRRTEFENARNNGTIRK